MPLDFDDATFVIQSALERLNINDCASPAVVFAYTRSISQFLLSDIPYGTFGSRCMALEKTLSQMGELSVKPLLESMPPHQLLERCEFNHKNMFSHRRATQNISDAVIVGTQHPIEDVAIDMMVVVRVPPQFKELNELFDSLLAYDGGFKDLHIQATQLKDEQASQWSALTAQHLNLVQGLIENNWVGCAQTQTQKLRNEQVQFLQGCNITEPNSFNQRLSLARKRQDLLEDFWRTKSDTEFKHK